MKVGLVALHYPRPEYRDEMISRVRRAAEVMMTTPGCLAVDCSRLTATVTAAASG